MIPIAGLLSGARYLNFEPALFRNLCSKVPVCYSPSMSMAVGQIELNGRGRIFVATPRLVLVEPTHQDYPIVVDLLSDPDLHKSEKPVADEGNVKKIFNYMIEHWSVYGFGTSLMIHKADDRVVGILAFKYMEVESDRMISLGFLCHPAYRGRGLVFEAAEAAIERGFAFLGVPKIGATVTPENSRAIHLLNGLGFSYAKDIHGRELSGVKYDFEQLWIKQRPTT